MKFSVLLVLVERGSRIRYIFFEFIIGRREIYRNSDGDGRGRRRERVMKIERKREIEE